MADKDEKKNSGPEKTDQEDLSPEEQEALEKIMAEIEAGGDKQQNGQKENSDNDDRDLTGDQQDEPENDPADEAKAATAEVSAVNPEESEKPAGEEVAGESPAETATDDMSADNDVENESSPPEKELDPDDLESELAKLVDQANSMLDEDEEDETVEPVEDSHGQESSGGPEDEPSADTRGQGSAEPEHTGSEPADPSMAEKEDSDNDDTDKSPPEQEDDGHSPAEEDGRVSFDPVYLDEVKPEPKGRPKSKLGKKSVLVFTFAILFAAAIGTALYVWLGQRPKAAPQTPAATPTGKDAVAQAEDIQPRDSGETVTAPSPSEQDIPVVAMQTQTGGKAMVAETAVRAVDKVEPADVPAQVASGLDTWLEKLDILRREIGAKKDEIISLKQYYRKRIAEKENEIAEIVSRKHIQSYSKAVANTRIELALRAIQRRYAYIAKLDSPLQRLEAVDEEILYYQRLTQIYKLMSGVISALPIEELEKELESVFAGNTEVIKTLGVRGDEVPLLPLETVWKRVYSDIAGNKSRITYDKADKSNKKIWKQICDGDFRQMHKLTRLSPEAAKCLLNWPGKDLYLNDVKELSPEVAKILSRWPGEWLSLNGITELAPETARYLAMWPGKRLSLNGLAELSPAATAELSKWQGEQLEMVGLRKIGRWDNYATKLFLSESLRRKLETVQ